MLSEKNDIYNVICIWMNLCRLGGKVKKKNNVMWNICLKKEAVQLEKEGTAKSSESISAFKCSQLIEYISSASLMTLKKRVFK